MNTTITSKRPLKSSRRSQRDESSAATEDRPSEVVRRPRERKAAAPAVEAVASPIESVTVETSAKERKPRKKAEKKTEVAVEEIASEVVSEIASEAVEEEEVVEDSKSKRVRADVLDRFDGILSTMNDELERAKAANDKASVKFLKALLKDSKRLRTDTAKAMKISKKRKSSSAPSGFNKPVRISEELSKFLKDSLKEDGTRVVGEDGLVARKDVTSSICAYIKAHSLQSPQDGRIIVPDKKLAKIVNYTEGDRLDYFNLQTKIKHHYIRDE